MENQAKISRVASSSLGGTQFLSAATGTRHGEIDIVAKDGDTVVFVEVKMKSSAECGVAAESVTPWKQRRVGRMAVDYIARRGLHDRPARFDVVAIDVVEGVPRVTVIPNAFDLVE